MYGVQRRICRLLQDMTKKNNGAARGRINENRGNLGFRFVARDTRQVILLLCSEGTGYPNYRCI